MVTGGGRIAFAHVEQVIDFETIDGVYKYVERNTKTGRKIFYLDEKDHPTGYFDEGQHVTFSEEGYTIKVWVPYNGLNMGC